jgi:hypothetical protein
MILNTQSIVQRFLIATMIITALGWQCIGAWQDSQTTDEAVHLTSGRAYWQKVMYPRASAIE